MKLGDKDVDFSLVLPFVVGDWLELSKAGVDYRALRSIDGITLDVLVAITTLAVKKTGAAVDVNKLHMLDLVAVFEKVMEAEGSVSRPT